MPLLCSYLCIYDGLQHTSAASSSPSIILSIYGRNFLPLAYSLQKIGVHIDEDGKIIVDVMHWYELNLKALYGLMSLVYCAVYTWIYIRLYSHAHPHKMKSPSASCSLPSKCTTTQYHATINFLRERIMPQSITCNNQLGQYNQCLYSWHTYLYVWTQLFTYHAYMHKWRLNEMTRQSTLMVWEGQKGFGMRMDTTINFDSMRRDYAA